MIYKFLLLSDEVESFTREISINANASFLELNDAIIEAVGYSKDQLTSFFLCEDNWEKREEITLMDMGTSSFEDDILLMEETIISDYVEDEHQRLLFQFDIMADRSLFMELREIEFGKDLSEPMCSQSKGKAPKQALTIEEVDSKTVATTASAAMMDIDDDYGFENSYNQDELDFDGLSDVDFSDDLNY